MNSFPVWGIGLKYRRPELLDRRLIQSRKTPLSFLKNPDSHLAARWVDDTNGVLELEDVEGIAHGRPLDY